MNSQIIEVQDSQGESLGFVKASDDSANIAIVQDENAATVYDSAYTADDQARFYSQIWPHAITSTALIAARFVAIPAPHSH
jgi:hypothetical protein